MKGLGTVPLDQQIALVFVDKANYEKAEALVNARSLPHAAPGSLTLIVRTTDRRLFKDQGLDFFAARLATRDETSGYLRVSFREAVPFGLFCVALRSHNVTFTLAGSKAVILADHDYKDLPPEASHLLQDAQAKGVVKVKAATDHHPSRILRTEEETEALLVKFAKAL